MLANTIDILLNAKNEGYAIAAANVCNETTARSAIEVACENNAPIIIDLTFRGNPYIGLLVKSVIEMAKEAPVPIAMNLDYCDSYADTMKALKLGFSSVMLDRTDKTFEQNIRETCEIVEVAHALGASVEGLLGRVVTAEEIKKNGMPSFTDPYQANEYIKCTNIDALAIAIGTVRGKYDFEPTLDFERLSQIKKMTDIPLVLHGGSYTGEENLKKAVALGVNKVNVSYSLYEAGNKAVTECISNFNHPRDIFKVFSEGYKNELLRYMRIFNQCGKAK